MTSISPTSVTVGGGGFTLTVDGSGFILTSVVRWDGANRTTTFVSANQLTAVIPATDLAASGTPQVTVFNPGGGVSGAVTFTILAPPPGVIERVSVATDGAEGNFSSGSVKTSISADGRFVAFGSSADNLVAGDTNGRVDIFVRDTCAGAAGCTPSTVRVSVADDGAQGNSDSGSFGIIVGLSISTDGRFVAFGSRATNLVAGDTNSRVDVFVRDTCAGATGCTPSTIRVSVAGGGAQGNDPSFVPSISADGRFVAFLSFASNLVADDTNGMFDVFVRDTCAGATGCTPSTIRVSVASDGAQGNNLSEMPSISADGRFVAFHSFATNLVAGDTNSDADIFVRDTCFGATGCTPSTIRVSVAGDGAQGNFASVLPSISADGRFVAFDSAANTLVAGDTNGVFDVFVRDTCFGATGCTPSTIRVSVAGDGAQSNSSNGDTAISADGRFVAFSSFATNLVTGDTNGDIDVFVRDTCVGATGCTPSTVRVSVAGNGAQGDLGSRRPPISADGRFVGFESFATNLVPGDTNGARDIFLARTGF